VHRDFLITLYFASNNNVIPVMVTVNLRLFQLLLTALNIFPWWWRLRSKCVVENHRGHKYDPTHVVYLARYGTIKGLSVTASAQFDWSSYFGTNVASVHTVPDRSHEAYCPLTLRPTALSHWSLLFFHTVAYCTVALKAIVLLHWSLLSFDMPITL
jgi:hypothetical protein